MSDSAAAAPAADTGAEGYHDKHGSGVDGTTEPYACTMFKYIYSTCLLIFSIIIIMGLIFTSQTTYARDVHPVMAFFLFWAMIVWLSMVEGGQASLVGLAPIHFDLYKDTHKVTYKNTKIVHKGDNLDRYLMGRQFMVIFIVFLINNSGGPIPGADLWGFPPMLTQIFLVSGFAMILVTCMVGQLNTQVNASHCMLDFINNYFAVFTHAVAMAIEWTGLMHFSYIIQMLVGYLAGKPIESKEPPRSAISNIWFYTRCLFSLVALGFCFAVTLKALFDGNTTMWQGVPEAVSVILFFFFFFVVGLLEGMQIAFFAVAKLRAADRGEHKCAKMTCELLFRNRGHNLAGFMIGRQLCVVSCFFIIARVTTISLKEGEPNIFGVSDGLQQLFNTGLLGAVITTIVGSISWQLVASAFPIAFLSNPFTYIFLRICLFFEATGICSGAWVLAKLGKKVFHYQRDEVYIGTAEERAAKNMADEEIDMEGHMYKLPGFAEIEEMPQSLQDLLKSDPNVMRYMESLHESIHGPTKGQDDTERDVDDFSSDGDEGGVKQVKSIEYEA